jgi:hypothetical protein
MSIAVTLKIAPILTAADLRVTMAKNEADRVAEARLARERAERSQVDHAEQFLHERLNKTDLAALRTRIIAAAARGAFVALILRFPSQLCSDDGRAVGNAEAHWPETLPGKARGAFLLWERVGRPNGFALRAAILDYPGGMPGDVGLFLDWSPPLPR